MAEGTEPQRTQRIPGWLLGIACALAVTASTAAAKGLVDEARLDVRVSQLESDRRDDRASLAGVPAQLATLTAQIVSLSQRVEDLTRKLDEHHR